MLHRPGQAPGAVLREQLSDFSPGDRQGKEGGVIVYVLEMWKTDGYDTWTVDIKVFSKEEDALKAGEDYVAEAATDTYTTSEYGIYSKELL